MSAEASIIRNYLYVLVSLPWGKTSQRHIDINKAKKIDDDHYGLEHVSFNRLSLIWAVFKARNVVPWC